ncbi:SET domain-containing protein [Clavulina sp. PMI_390]|nr:SET domain-containing protein [Clavulina sp. PMI_390]
MATSKGKGSSSPKPKTSSSTSTVVPDVPSIPAQIDPEHQRKVLQHAQRFVPVIRAGGPAPSRYRFENAMRQNTQEEDFAPRIYIINDVDAEPCPPMDFLFTNKLIFGEGVPDLTKNAGGCTCEGVCEPLAGKCLCAGLQAAYYDAAHDGETLQTGWMYTEDGRLKEFNTRVVECNEHCGCSPDCYNKVVMKGRTVKISVKKTKNRGWGISAAENIPQGTFLGYYAGEVVTASEALERGAIYDQAGSSYLFDLDFDEHESPTTFEAFSVDARYVGNHTRFFNHSCNPNCAITPVQSKSRDPRLYNLAVFSKVDVKDGEELTFDYAPNSGDLDPALLRTEAVYIPCACGSKDCRGRIWG